MRLIVDSLIALMLICILGAIIVHYQEKQRQLHNVEFVQRSLARLHEQATYHRAMNNVADGELEAGTGFPRRIAPQWFEQHLPLNVLVPLRQPWIDVAPSGDQSDHPPDPVIDGPKQAGFWYNPNRGIFRARVPAQFSQKRTLWMYNQVNGTALAALSIEPSAARAPEPNPIVPEPGLRRAAREASTTRLDRTVEMVRDAATALLESGPASASAAQSEAPADDSTVEYEAQQGAHHSEHEAVQETEAPRRSRRPTLLSEPKQEPVHE